MRDKESRMSRILDLPMTHEVTYVPAGRRNSVTSKYRLPVRVEVEEAASSEFEPLLRFNAGPDVFNAAGLEPMARLMGNVVHIVRGREVYAPIDEAHFSGIMTPSISRDRDFQVPFIRTAAERLQEQAPFLETSARSIEADGRDEAVAMAHEIAANLVFVDGKLFKRVNPPIFDLRSNYRLLTDVYQQDRPLFGLDLPCTEVGHMLPMFGLSPDLVTCSLDMPVDLAHARRALRTMLATVKMENEARGAGLAWRISRHDLSRRIDRISTPADVVSVAREFHLRFSSSPAFTDGTFPKMLLRLIEFYGSYDAKLVVPGEVALTFESRDDKVTLVEIDGHLYRRSDPMNAAHLSMDLDFEDMHPVVVDEEGILWAQGAASDARLQRRRPDVLLPDSAEAGNGHHSSGNGGPRHRRGAVQARRARYCLPGRAHGGSGHRRAFGGVSPARDDHRLRLRPSGAGGELLHHAFHRSDRRPGRCGDDASARP